MKWIVKKILFSAPAAEDLSEFKWCESLWKKWTEKCVMQAKEKPNAHTKKKLWRSMNGMCRIKKRDWPWEKKLQKGKEEGEKQKMKDQNWRWQQRNISIPASIKFHRRRRMLSNKRPGRNSERIKLTMWTPAAAKPHRRIRRKKQMTDVCWKDFAERKSK